MLRWRNGEPRGDHSACGLMYVVEPTAGACCRRGSVTGYKGHMRRPRLIQQCIGSTIERAFEPARSGEYQDIQAIKRQLRAEGYPAVTAHLSGRSICDDLRAVNPAAKASTVLFAAPKE